MRAGLRRPEKVLFMNRPRCFMFMPLGRYGCMVANFGAPAANWLNAQRGCRIICTMFRSVMRGGMERPLRISFGR